MKLSSTPCNPSASKEARNLMQYIVDISGNSILLGQHTQTRKQEELNYIEKITGKLPAICGFELLSYSGNINWDSCNTECLEELYNNLGTIENAISWGKRGGIVTMTWHLYSPIGGKDKSFYSINTDFDAEAALLDGTAEHEALLRDLDLVAIQLKRFQALNIPILWRPFHEAEGNWFWWGAKGTAIAGKLYRFMYTYYTEVHHLNHLLWVWNAPVKEGYPGDDVVDIISRDLYPPAYEHTSHAVSYAELTQITSALKPCAIAEIGTQPDVARVITEQIPWCWFMTWSKAFCTTEKFTTHQQLLKNYQHPNAITLDKLPNFHS